MSFSEKFVRAQIKRFGPYTKNLSLRSFRKGQTQVISLISAKSRKCVSFEDEKIGSLSASLTTPKSVRFEGVALYLHGGGYCSGDLTYAKCFSAMFANKCGIKVYTVEYRLAPESPFPAALDDALAAYRRLLECGYRGKDIVLCGESAGGGLIYSLALKLRELGMEMPCGIVAISPWSDLTASGESYKTNKEKDFSISEEQLDYFASKYAANRADPFVSPAFAELDRMPPSLIFVGGDEILLDDSRILHTKLQEAGCQSELIIKPGLWHAYMMYDLNETQDDYGAIREFLSSVLPAYRERMWLKLDNAAKIYPASRSRTWSNLFRLSATLYDEVDTDILRVALGVTVRRFPSISARLSWGAFWYYLEELNAPPVIKEDVGHPAELMKYTDMRKCALRVLVYGRRIAVEFFHSITDGTGGMIFLKSLLAEYAERKYGKPIPCEMGIKDRHGEISEDELEDSFLKNAGSATLSRKEPTAFFLKGTKENDGFVHALTFIAETDDIRRLSKEHGVSVTAFLCAVLMQALTELQSERLKRGEKPKPIKVMLPVNLRNIFNSNTVRNFALYINPEIDPAMGEYSFEEICKSVYHQMGLELTANRMRARLTTNVNDEKSLFIKLTPLFIKNAIMKSIFNAVGERTTCLSLSNLGAVSIPDELAKHIERFDFTLNVPSKTHHNCGVISFGGKTYISFVRNISEPCLEFKFHEILRKMGIRMKVESNSKE